MLTFLWLLLPVAAAAGWFAARRSGARAAGDFWRYTTNFHEGLNDLLNHQPDDAAELFIAPGGTARDTAETHLALGNLFRRRGEFQRAILIHESLIANATLDNDLHADARYELARDYLTAGLMDRAQQELRELIASGQRVGDAYEALLDLHERAHDWAKAIEVAHDASGSDGEPVVSRLAHYHCELAAEAAAAGYREQASDWFRRALDTDPQCARAHVALGDLALADGRYDDALVQYEAVERLKPQLLPEVIDSIFDALQKLGDEPRLRATVEHIRGRRNAYTVIRATRDVIESLDGATAADRFFKQQILQRPSLKGLRDWAHDQIAISKPEERGKVQVITAMLDQVVEDKPAYQCANCGFGGNQLHWRCPSCGQWDTVHTIIGVEGE